MSFFRRLLGRQHRDALLAAQALTTIKMNELTAHFTDETIRLSTEIDALKAQVAQLLDVQAQRAARVDDAIHSLSGELEALKEHMPRLLNAAGTVPALADKLRQFEKALIQGQESISQLHDDVQGRIRSVGEHVTER